MTGLDAAVTPLAILADATLRIWRLDGATWTVVAGPAAPRPTAPQDASFVALPDAADLWLEVVPRSGQPLDAVVRRVLPVVAHLVQSDATVAHLTTELATRYEEIDLIFTIGELLGRVASVDEVARHILDEVASVIGARRAGIRLLDPATGQLRLVAIIGSKIDAIPPVISIDAPDDVVVARAARTRRIATGLQPSWVEGEVLAVPMIHGSGDEPRRVIGTLSLADRAGGGRFTREETKLLVAVAGQIGTAIENTRLSELARERAALERELSLAHDLQQKLMPTASVLDGDAELALLNQPAESLGGDFYTFARFGRGRVGVMLGDVSSHGFSAALIAAQVMATAGIYANAAIAPDETLALIRESLGEDLAQTEMYLTVFYGIFEPLAGRLAFSNAGHPYAFQVPRFGPAVRLPPTAPPLGLVNEGEFGRTVVPWSFGVDTLVLCTDGLLDQANAVGERYGEERLIAQIEAGRGLSPELLKDRVLADVAGFGGRPVDDITVLILRM